MTTTNTSYLSLVNEKYLPAFKIGIAAVGLAAVATVQPIEAVRIIGMTVLTGVSYGIANDMIACRECIEYFTVGHVYDGQNFDKRLVKTLDPNLNAVTWGVFATWHVCTLAGTLFSVLARSPLPGLALKVTAIQLAPYIIGGAVVTALISNFGSKLVLKLKEKGILQITLHNPVPKEFEDKWISVGGRNTIGYGCLALGGTILSIAIIAARAGLIGL